MREREKKLNVIGIGGVRRIITDFKKEETVFPF